MTRPMDIAYQIIKEKILNGAFLPSQKLIETDLANEINVSRNTIKKVLLQLQQEQLVDITANKGASVKSYTLDEVINYFEIREVLEVLVVGKVALNINDVELKNLEEILAEMSSHLLNNRYDEYSALNKEFHNVIYNASHNIQAVDMINMIKTQLMRYQIRTILLPGRNKESFKEHENLLYALKKHDVTLAENAIKKHISNIRKTIENNYSYLV